MIKWYHRRIRESALLKHRLESDINTWVEPKKFISKRLYEFQWDQMEKHPLEELNWKQNN